MIPTIVPVNAMNNYSMSSRKRRGKQRPARIDRSRSHGAQARSAERPSGHRGRFDRPVRWHFEGGIGGKPIRNAGADHCTLTRQSEMTPDPSGPLERT